MRWSERKATGISVLPGKDLPLIISAYGSLEWGVGISVFLFVCLYTDCTVRYS